MHIPKVVIVGGGFGGVYTARNLSKIFRKGEIEVILINKRNYFLFTPLLHEVATGGLSPETIVEPVREVFRGKCVNFVEDTVIEIDRINRLVKTPTKTFNYDYLVISSGADTNYFNIPGAQEYTYSLKNEKDAMTLRNRLINVCEDAFRTRNKDILSVAVIGAGPTGVELTAEIKEYMEHTLCNYYKNSGFREEDIKVSIVTATPEIISNFPEKMRLLATEELNRKGIEVISNAIVTKVEQGKIFFKDGSILEVNTIVWVAGVISTLNQLVGLEVGPKGRLEVNEYLQSLHNPEVFAIGDAGGNFPMLAQVAVRQGQITAHNIYTLIKGKELKTFKFKENILLLSIGQGYAIGHFWNITLRGKIMWLIWRTVYLFNFLSLRKKIEIAVEWIINLFYPRDITLLK